MSEFFIPFLPSSLIKISLSRFFSLPLPSFVIASGHASIIFLLLRLPSLSIISSFTVCVPSHYSFSLLFSSSVFVLFFYFSSARARGIRTRRGKKLLISSLRKFKIIEACIQGVLAVVSWENLHVVENFLCGNFLCPVEKRCCFCWRSLIFGRKGNNFLPTFLFTISPPSVLSWILPSPTI